MPYECLFLNERGCFFYIQVLYAFFDTLEDSNREIKRVLRIKGHLLRCDFALKRGTNLEVSVMNTKASIMEHSLH